VQQPENSNLIFFLVLHHPMQLIPLFFLNKPHIALDDTEAAKFGQFFYLPFTQTKLNPSGFKKIFQRKPGEV